MTKFHRSVALLIRWLLLPLAMSTSVSLGAPENESAGSGFVLEDLLNRTWTNELVMFPLSKEQRSALDAGQGLADPDGKALPYQIDGDSIAFQANLGPYERKEYLIRQGAVAAETGLRVTETDDVIEMVNGKTGVRVRKKLAGHDGPIAGILLSDGTWTSGSRLGFDPGECQYEASVTKKGAVFIAVECNLTRGEASWNLKLWLQAGEPVILVDEVSTLGEGDSWDVELSGDGFVPGHLLHRAGWVVKQPLTRGIVYGTEFAPDKNNVIYNIQPWVQWWQGNSAKWVGLYDNGKSPLLMLGARDSEVWAEVSEGPTNRLILGSGAQPFRLFDKNDRQFAQLPLVSCRRNWMIGSVSKEESLEMIKKADGKVGQDRTITPLPQEYVIKYEFPLQKVRQLVLDWPETEEHPRLFITRKQLEELEAKSDLKKKQDVAPEQTNVGKKKRPQAKVESPKDKIEKAITLSDELLDVYFRQNLVANSTSLGMAPHHHYPRLIAALIAIDAALATDTVTPEERRRLRAKAAFAGYTVIREDFWSPERGYANHLNMTSFVSGMQVMAGSLLASHPMGKTWAEKGLATFRSQLDTATGRDGGWQEAPHYAMATFDTLTGSFTMAENSGYADMLYDPRIKKIGEWFAKISTPPDSRFGGRRHFPHIGHTYLYETSGKYGVLAALWKDKDPEFAGNMRWMWEQHGKPSDPGIGGSAPMYGAYRGELLKIAETIEPVAPKYGSEWFRDTGVVFRSGFPSDRETMMTVIAGKNHDHYDKDSGSFTLWGKGRIVSDDFGYYAYAPSSDHNMVTSGFSQQNKTFRASDFSSGEWADYMKGASDDWIRQILFVKDVDPLRPNYFVVRDGFPKPGDAVSRTFFVAESVELTERGARVTGTEDVDTDVFYAFPQQPQLALQMKTTEGHGAFPDGRQGKIKYTQTGLIASVKNEPGFMAVIYPRLKSEKAPVFTSMGEGRVVKVQSEAGTDYVFLSAEKFTFEEEGITFEGTAGTAQMRGDNLRLTLGAAGRIATREHELAADGPKEQSWK